MASTRNINISDTSGTTIAIVTSRVVTNDAHTDPPAHPAQYPLLQRPTDIGENSAPDQRHDKGLQHPEGEQDDAQDQSGDQHPSEPGRGG